MERIVQEDDASVLQNAEDSKFEGPQRSDGEVSSAFGRCGIVIPLGSFYQKLPHPSGGSDLAACGVNFEPKEEYKDEDNGCMNLDCIRENTSQERTCVSRSPSIL